jgi:elongation factor P--beta-lysine ligase
LEKLGPKQKGIVSQSVKEVLDSLVADNIVTAEKIGTSNYFWAFPSTAGHQRRKRLDDLHAELDQLVSQRDELNAKVDAANEGREESSDRNDLLEQLQQAERLRSGLDQELQKFADNDPAVIEALRNDIKTCTVATNRWTGILYVCGIL